MSTHTGASSGFGARVFRRERLGARRAIRAARRHQRAVDQARDSIGAVDVLVNNAVVHYNVKQDVRSADWTIIHEAFEKNVFGAWRMFQAFLPVCETMAGVSS